MLSFLVFFLCFIMILNPPGPLFFFSKPLFQAIVKPSAPFSHENSGQHDFFSSCLLFSSSRFLRRISAMAFEMTMTLHLPRVDLWRESATVSHCNETYKNIRMTAMYIRHFAFIFFQSKQKYFWVWRIHVFVSFSLKIAMVYPIKSCISQ